MQDAIERPQLPGVIVLMVSPNRFAAFFERPTSMASSVSLEGGARVEGADSGAGPAKRAGDSTWRDAGVAAEAARPFSPYP
jgi:hypothetical protein